MARLTEKKLREVKERILNGNSFLELEAFHLQIPEEELEKELESFYSGGRKNSEFKAVIRNSKMRSERLTEEELSQLRVMPKLKVKKAKTPKVSSVHVESVPAEAFVTEYVTASIPATVTESITATEKMGMLLEEEKSLLEEVDEKKKLFLNKEEALNVAIEQLERAQANVGKAKAEKVEAETNVAEAERKLKEVEDKIQDLKMQTVYLVDPGFTGVYPTSWGTYFSTAGWITGGVPISVHFIEVEEEYFPEATLEDVLKFEMVADYNRARAFVGLVTKFELEGKAYSLLVSDERIRKMLNKYIF